MREQWRDAAEEIPILFLTVNEVVGGSIGFQKGYHLIIPHREKWETGVEVSQEILEPDTL